MSNFIPIDGPPTGAVWEKIMFVETYSHPSAGELDHCEERRFIAMREGTEDLACWASQIMGHCDEFGGAYCEALVARFLEGAGAPDIVASVRRDLLASGHAERAVEIAVVFALSIAKAYGRSNADAPVCSHGSRFREKAPHPHGFWGWSL